MDRSFIKHLLLGIILTAGTVAAAKAQTYTLDVHAYIDGRDQLIIQGGALQWHHFDYAAVGRWSGANEPTVISTTFNGLTEMDHVNWFPSWPESPPAEIRYEAYSSLFTDLAPAVPQQLLSASLEVVSARGEISIVQQPAANNNYTTIVQFNDNVPSEPAYYEGKLTFTPVPEPSATLLLGLGALVLYRNGLFKLH